MPNWCENIVRVHADTAGELQRFTTHVASEDNPFSFNSILPMPRELTGTLAPAQICTPDEYHDWIKEEVSVEIDDTVAEYMFDTAWGPPEEIYNHLVETFPDHQINWYFHEPNMLMAGYLGED